jgi:hypothetical protein
VVAEVSALITGEDWNAQTASMLGGARHEASETIEFRSRLTARWARGGHEEALTDTRGCPG